MNILVDWYIYIYIYMYIYIYIHHFNVVLPEIYAGSVKYKSNITIRLYPWFSHTPGQYNLC